MAISGISVLLCLAFLVAIPVTAIAAEQDDYVLGIYGNANEDDTIDMRDLTYVKLIFFGKKPETELADAKYDGKINPLDFIQIKLIIVGKEKELTIEDVLGEAETVYKPVQRITVGYSPKAEILRILYAKDKIVGIDTAILQQPNFFPELSRLPVAGNFRKPNYEVVLSLKTDVYLPYLSPDPVTTIAKKNKWKEKLPGVTIIFLDTTTIETFAENMRKLGYILDRKDEAEKYVDWYNGYMDEIKFQTDGLSEDEKPQVYIEFWSAYSAFPKVPMCDIAGGRNIADNLTGASVKIDPEWLMEQNPEIIVRYQCMAYVCGYETDDTSEIIAVRDEILNRPELARVTAVKHGRVYVIDMRHFGWGPGHLISTAYFAKWFHPELFEDLDPREIHQEYLDRFQRIDFNVKEHGVFVYPPLEG